MMKVKRVKKRVMEGKLVTVRVTSKLRVKKIKRTVAFQTRCKNHYKNNSAISTNLCYMVTPVLQQPE